MNIIYEPKGAALEYSPLAANLYRGCSHGCTYCYAPGVLRISPDAFKCNPAARVNVLAALEKDAKQMSGDPRPVLLSFTSDPYQPIESDLQLTRRAIEILGQNRMKIRVLTKNGKLARRDFDLMKRFDVEFGSTILFTSDAQRRIWEPDAGTVRERYDAMAEAHSIGLRTWVSIEPVISPEQALKVIDAMHPFVDLFKVGRWNHDAKANATDWAGLLKIVLERFDATHNGYYIKDEFWKYATPEIKARWAKERSFVNDPAVY
jgi:DNA repair photolyase